MIPNKSNNNQNTNTQAETAKPAASFAPFDIMLLLRRLLRGWYWFALMLFIGYAIATIYSRYYAQRVYASTLSLSIDRSSSGYATPSQSINFIWGSSGNSEGLFLKK